MAEYVNIENSKRGKKDEFTIMENLERFERFIKSVNIGLQDVKKVEAMDALPLNDLEPERLKDLAEKAAFAAGSMYRYAELMRELAE